jgi:hypothetical protein
METPYLKLAKKKSCFSLYLLSFFFYKIREQEGRTSPGWGWGWYQWEGRGEVAGKGVGR